MRSLIAFLKKLYRPGRPSPTAFANLRARLAEHLGRLWLADWVFAAALILHALGVWWAWLTASLPLGALFVLSGGLTVVLYSEYAHAR